MLKPEQLGKSMTITYIQQKEKIQSEARSIPDSWDAGDYVRSGQSLGNLITILFGLESY